MKRQLTTKPSSCWLSQGKVLPCYYELQQKLWEFSQELTNDDLVVDRWCTKLACHADLFGHFSKFNSKLQDKSENILSSTDKIWEFMAKLFLLHKVLKQASMDMSPLAIAVPKAAKEHAVFA